MVASCGAGDGGRTISDESNTTEVASQASAGIVSACDKSEQIARLTGVEYPTTSDARQVFALGPLEIEIFSPITITDLENRTTFSIQVTNSGDQPETVVIPNASELFAAGDRSGRFRPTWIWHISLEHRDVFSETGSYELVVDTKSSTSFNIYVSRDAEPGEVEGQIDIPIELAGTDLRVVVPVRVRSISGLWGPSGVRAPASAELKGLVRDEDGDPIANALVTAALSSGEFSRWVRTNPYGMFTIPVISDRGLSQIAGPRPIQPEPAWSLTVDADGYGLWSMEKVQLNDGEARECSIYLASAPTRTYGVSSIIDDTDNGVGFWDMDFFGGKDRLIAIPGLHPPGRGLPGNIIGFDLDGRVLWKLAVPDFCWRVVVSPKDDLAAVPCSDGVLRVITSDGELIHSHRLSNHENSSTGLAFSPDGLRLAVSTDDGVVVLDTRTWDTLWTDSLDSYMMAWSDTKAGLVSGSSDAGVTTSFTDDGVVQWRVASGYVPFIVQIDDSGRVMIAGKRRRVMLLDSEGKQLMTREVAHTVNRARQNRSASSDGSLRVASTFNGLIYGFGADGSLLWQRWLPVREEPDPSGGTMLRVPGPGHGATYVAPDGSFVVIGTRGTQVVMLDARGSMLWESESYAPRSGYEDGGGYHPATNSVLATDDGAVLVAGYSDATIRIFRRQD